MSNETVKSTSRRARKKAAPKEPIQSNPKVEPGPRTKAAIAEATRAYEEMPVRAYVKWSRREDGAFVLASPHTDIEGWALHLAAALGSTSTSFATQQLTALEAATRRRGAKVSDETDPLNAALAIVQAIGPENELETALAVQMAGCHALSCEMMSLTKSADTTDRLVAYGNLAIKFQRTFTAQVEALARMRGKGQQTVRVEHVTVHPGGQAIVGDVHHHPRGAGAQEKGQDQPHGTGQPAERPALPSPDPLGNGVPLPGNAERPLQAARRPVARRAARKPERAQARTVER